MRGHQAAKPADRISRAVILLAGVSCGAVALTVGLPLAQSSPYPAARENLWATPAASSYQLASVSASIGATERTKPTAIEWEALTAPTLTRESLALLAKSIPEPIWESDADAPTMTGSLAGPVRLASLSPNLSPVTAPPVKAVVAPAKRAKIPAATPATTPAAKTVIAPMPVEPVAPAAEPEVAAVTAASEPATMQLASVAPSAPVAAPAVKAVAAPTKRAKAPATKAPAAAPPPVAAVPVLTTTPPAAESEIARETAASEPASMQLASATSVPVVLPPVEPEGTSIELEAEVVANAQLAAAAPASDAAPVKLASIGPNLPAAAPPTKAVVAPETVKRNAGPMAEVDEYLWEVYQREPVKKDSAGDFTWKDPAAAKRIGKSMPDYVIGGMDRDFREQLYHAGKAMDGAGVKWSMLSAFRDDYRQQIAAGFKARTGNSLHGGSRATGGYGNGRAADVVSADGDHGAVWRWIDRNGAKYGLRRPMPSADPAHIQAGGTWHDIAIALRDTRSKVANANASVKEASAKSKTSIGAEKDKKSAD